ncbi:cystinosin homolog isoform X1 [Brassica napus]|uniref:cystinosin homolog isoform X1 n=1 Tax=Brassica napus TaxID=3708 RepID=UPI0020788C34|nr:cystinosin homolog isoform X1 [Brassica napus]
MASWNSIPLEISYEVVGWIAFTSWSISFYPQLILNFRRKSVVGLNFDFVLLNLTKHSSYMIYNVCLYFSPIIQKQYFDTYGDQEMIPVAANDVAFSIHAVVLTALTLFQIFIYERGPQKVSRFATGLVVLVWGFAAICFFIALPTHSWLWLITIFNSIQVAMTCVKYIPQVRNDSELYIFASRVIHLYYSCSCVSSQAKMNFTRKSTVGWSIGNILLDFGGGLANYLQMVIQSIDQNSWVNFYGNIGKTLLSLISIFFDILFMFQHYVLYPEKKSPKSPETGEESNEPLIDPSHEHV